MGDRARTYPIPRAVALTLAAALVGLATNLAAEAAGWEFPSFGYLAGEVVWNLATIGVMVWALRRYEQRGLDAEATGFANTPPDVPMGGRVRIAIPGIATALAAAFLLPALVGSGAGDSDAYGDVHKAGAALAAAEILVRYPLTVFAEEAFFRGWLQPRLPLAAPVLSGVLWGAYHLQQAATIPSLIAFGVALGVIRWWTGNVRTTAAIHYVSNVVFFVGTYL